MHDLEERHCGQRAQGLEALHPGHVLQPGCLPTGACGGSSVWVGGVGSGVRSIVLLIVSGGGYIIESKQK